MSTDLVALLTEHSALLRQVLTEVRELRETAGKPQKTARPSLTERILSVLSETPEGLTVSELAAKVESSREGVAEYMRRLHQAGKVRRTAEFSGGVGAPRGRYFAREAA